ncbi:cysteine desulfurase NifS [candidate division TA06 bacterium]|uniref:Cysteine desulfurase n=1 Tax=candidate division TA06 bacterium TaxID=2250710 RepID=A0A933MHS9_UNCT6|nr:cysteine desulfurase NifS [candidate division TA06 bacterium]
MPAIYFDHNATTPVRPEVLEAMLPFYQNGYGNASSLYALGREARQAIEESRRKIAAVLNCEPAEIVFTGSGTEADNHAIKGVFFANRVGRSGLVTSKIEHHAVLHSFEYLEKHHGAKTVYLGVDGEGLVDLEGLSQAITPETALVSIMHANNEVGAIQPLPEISKICRDQNVYLHTDAVQTFGKIETDVKKLGVNLLSLSGHKIYAPKGVGALYIKKGTRIHPLIHGGGHEKNRRAGTENVAGIVALARAAELAAGERESQALKLTELRERLWQGLQKNISHLRRNSPSDLGLPGTLNVSFEFIEGESILLLLDIKGIAASSGSACTSGSLEPSHVLAAMGVPTETAQGSVRFSLGRENTEQEVDYVIAELPAIISRLRQMSPIAPRESCRINDKSS